MIPVPITTYHYPATYNSKPVSTSSIANQTEVHTTRIVRPRRKGQ